MAINEQTIRGIVREVLRELKQGTAPESTAPMAPAMAPTVETDGGIGVFATIDQAVEAAVEAQLTLAGQTLELRGAIVEAMRRCSLERAEDFSRRTIAETGMGRLEHKIAKHRLVATKTPGIEILQAQSFTGDRGLTVIERAPYGVIGAVTPSTNPCPTLINNAIGIIAAGNAAVFNPHPASKGVFAYAIDALNKAIVEAGGPRNLLTCPARPTLETAQEIFSHPRIRLLLVTGGPGVVQAALSSQKKAITAGAGNPPVVVDETADLAHAAQCIIEGASFDNNIVCVVEKEVFCVETVMDELKREMLSRHCVELNSGQIEALAAQAFQYSDGAGCGTPVLNRALIGKNADVLARAIGLDVAPDTLLLIGETAPDHPFVMEEQMMPFLPLVRCCDVNEAIERALVAERGLGHTSVMHSKNVENMSKMARLVNTTLFVKNGPSLAGLGAGGEGYTSFSIASPTGEGLTTALNFTRERRCSLVDYFRIV